MEGGREGGSGRASDEELPTFAFRSGVFVCVERERERERERDKNLVLIAPPLR